jgi:hypothetical protein
MINSDDFKRLDIHDEELIAKTMNYLKYHDPENATREDAISLLAFMQTVAKEVAETMSADSFDDYYKAYKEHRAKQ